jgi:hypothetical protein
MILRLLCILYLSTISNVYADDKFYSELAKYYDRAQCIIILQHFLGVNYSIDQKLDICTTIIKHSDDVIDALATAWRESNFTNVVDYTGSSYGPLQFIKTHWCDEKRWGPVNCEPIQRGIWVHNYHFKTIKNERKRFCAYIGAKDCFSPKIDNMWKQHQSRKRQIKKRFYLIK